jgi:hypothetical protein
MKNCARLIAFGLAALLPVFVSGCKSMKLEKAKARSAKLAPKMTTDEVYKLMKAPQATLAGTYWWEYYWPGEGGGRLLRIKFVESQGKWVVGEWEWE